MDSLILESWTSLALVLQLPHELALSSHCPACCCHTRHRIHHNLLFNWVRETQDHGPINTWNRQCYIQPKAVGAENMTTTPKWTHISQNLVRWARARLRMDILLPGCSDIHRIAAAEPCNWRNISETLAF